ncbi:hypothetical protein E2C01_031937 [Portunus trituberculatus]|uniref:Uncharacterized protein n=1 Tax=Portunus trituberculatus TaxID=210409 RepID=A0A5B7EU43_PORTR|nr:hypothetical protein [Portunus trituberculatus]
MFHQTVTCWETVAIPASLGSSHHTCNPCLDLKQDIIEFSIFNWQLLPVPVELLNRIWVACIEQSCLKPAPPVPYEHLASHLHYVHYSSISVFLAPTTPSGFLEDSCRAGGCGTCCGGGCKAEQQYEYPAAAAAAVCLWGNGLV